MKIYLETKDKDAHRIVFCNENGKLVYSGEFVRRRATAYDTLHAFLYNLGIRKNKDQVVGMVTERPYKPGAFARNAGPKKKAKK